MRPSANEYRAAAPGSRDCTFEKRRLSQSLPCCEFADGYAARLSIHVFQNRETNLQTRRNGRGEGAPLAPARQSRPPPIELLIPSEDRFHTRPRQECSASHSYRGSSSPA